MIFLLVLNVRARKKVVSEDYEEDLEDTIHRLEEKILELEKERQDFELKNDASSVLCDYAAEAISNAMEMVSMLNFKLSAINSHDKFDFEKEELQSSCKELNQLL